MFVKKLLKSLVVRTLAQLGPQWRNTDKMPLLILTYHRVLPADDPCCAIEQAGMLVTPTTFEKQLQWLASYGFQFIHLSDWVAKRNAGQSLPTKCCAITFDDGWRDNYQHAYPILQRLRIPFHIYVVANRLDGNGDFWPGQVARLLQISIAQRLDFTRLADAAWLAELLPGGILPDAYSRELVDRVIDGCKRYPDSFIYEKLELLKDKLPQLADRDRVLLDRQELLSMLESGLLEVGSHSTNHTRLLDGLPEQQLQTEIVHSQQQLKDALNTDICTFCYPNGDYSNAALALATRHYVAAVTTHRGWNNARSNLHQLQRISMHEDATNTEPLFRAKLTGWI